MKGVTTVILSVMLCAVPVLVIATDGESMGFDSPMLQLYVNQKSMQAYWTEPIAGTEYTYKALLVPVRGVTEELGCTVEWYGDTDSVTVSDGQNVLKIVIGNSYYDWNGEQKTMNVPPRLIQDRTYVPVSLIVNRFDWSMTWAQNKEAIRIIKPPVSEEDIDLNLLVDYGIVSQEDLHKAGYITTLEALTAINNVCNGGMIVTKQEAWYDNWAPLNNPDDTTKGILLSLRGAGERGILTEQEMLALELEKNITNKEALVHLTRMVGNIDNCFGYYDELDFTKTEQTYQSALEKELIEEIDMTQADEPISRVEFYQLLYKSLFVKHKSSGWSVAERYIEKLVFKSEASQEEAMQPITGGGGNVPK